MRLVTLCSIPECCSGLGVYSYISPCMYTFRTDSTRMWTNRGYSSQIFSIYTLLVIKQIRNLQARLLLRMNLHEGEAASATRYFVGSTISAVQLGLLLQSSWVNPCYNLHLTLPVDLISKATVNSQKHFLVAPWTLAVESASPL